ncbi:MAG TPA: aspartyl protease family protein [Bacteroidales bacterium]|nr:aspartyl protease family protein [Bacteroidales bacterium]
MNKKRHSVKLHLYELEQHSFHIAVKGRWKNKTIHLIVDTGASRTCFDHDFFTQHDSDASIVENEADNVSITSSSFETNITTLTDLKIGKALIPEMQLVLLDMSHVNQAYKSLKLPSMQGILGSDFFVQHQATINFKTFKLNFWL